MANLTNEQKATLYNDMLFRYQRLQEEVRQIKAKSFEVSYQDQIKITQLEQQMKKLYENTMRLY
jgi:glutamate mutase epsilon subunit